MFNNGDDEDSDDNDEKFYRETVYNEDYYLELDNEMIRQSNLELDLERLEEKYLMTSSNQLRVILLCSFGAPA